MKKPLSTFCRSLLTLIFIGFVIDSNAQDDAESIIAKFNLNTSNLVNDINQEFNDHKPHGDYRCYVIAGVFKELSNAKGYVQTYRGASDGEVFIFKEPSEKYYVCVDGPLKLEEAKQEAVRLNEDSATKNLSDGNVWIFKK